MKISGLILSASDFVVRWFAVLVLVAAGAALAWPEPVANAFPVKAVNPLLGVVMFGMGLTLKPSDFAGVIRRPRSVAAGVFAQFLLMPLAAWALAKVFGLPPALALGVVLVGTCPGGTASNVITYLARGDVALSVTLTACSTVLAPVLTPLLTDFCAGAEIDVDAAGMFISIVQVVLLPVAMGLVANVLFGRFTSRIARVLPLVSALAIAAIVLGVVARSAEAIRTNGFMIILVVALHNVFGLLSGYALAALARLRPDERRTVAIEVGMQNSGLAVSLASTHFASAPLAAVPGAVFSVWHNISGAVVANLFRHVHRDRESPRSPSARETSGTAARSLFV